MIKSFISHTSADHQFVEWLETRLERDKLGLDIFIDDGSVFVGDNPQKMIDEVRKSVIFLPILSNESVQKEFVQNEIKTALSNETTHIFPIRLKCDDASIPEEFKNKFKEYDKVDGKIYEDFSSEQEWDIRYEKLRTAIFNKIVELGLFKEGTKDYYQDCEHLDLILKRDEPTIVEIKMVIDIYLKREEYQRYFFSKLTNVKWLKYLKLYGYLRTSPQPIEDVHSPGLFAIPQWHALVYLERVSSQAAISEETINELLGIINTVSNLKDFSGQKIDNYRTWYYFTKILLNLPAEKIPEDIINLIPVWLDSKFSTSLPGSEIVQKLLPKLLNSDNQEDWKKAERLVDIVTDIKWVPLSLSQRSIYEKEIEAKTVIEPHWLRKSFEKNFERIGTICSTHVIETIAQRLLGIFSKEHGHAYDVDYEGKKYQITHLLTESGQHQILAHSLRYPEDWDGFSRSKVEKSPVINPFLVSNIYNRADFVSKVKEGLIKEAIFAALGTELDEPISVIYSLHDYTYIGYNSLGASLDDVRVDDEKILIYLLTGILSVKAQHDIVGTRKILGKFTSNEYPYPLFKRLVLLIAGKEWNQYKDYFFELLCFGEINCFEESDYAVELSNLLKYNLGKFTADEKETIKEIIETGPQWLPDENPEKYKAYWRQKWLSVMKNDPQFALLFKEQQQLTGLATEKFDFGSEIKVSSGFGQSPLSAAEILKLPTAELVIKLKEFRSEKKLDGLTVAAFAGTLKEAVKISPKQFIDSLKLFENVGFTYVYKILDGLREAWNEKVTIDWYKVLDFVLAYIKQDGFWEDKFVVEKDSWLGEANHQWIAGIVADLVQDGTRDDAWAFPEGHFEKAQEIVFLLVDNLKTEEDKEIADYVSYTLNTALGRTITALVLLALRIARVEDKKGVLRDARWSSEIKEKYEAILEKRSFEGYVNLGRYMPNFYYLEKKWLQGKIESLKGEKGSRYWEAFMNGYLSNGKVYDDLYELMKQHYQYSLSYDFQEERDREYVIQHICIGYLRGREKLDDHDSLFSKLIDTWLPDQIQEVISFFWMQRDYLNETTEENNKIRGKITEFGKRLYWRYAGKDETSLTQEDKRLLSMVSKLTTFLPAMDPESYEWLMASANHVNEDSDSAFFIEYLNELKDKGDNIKTAQYIGDIYLKMLDKCTPVFDKEHIRSIVEYLYQAGATDAASKVCNIYGARGEEFLRDIYDRYAQR